jgi:hypothetical protein
VPALALAVFSQLLGMAGYSADHPLFIPFIVDLLRHAGKNEIQQLSGFAADGETRTRTGDTTIFRQMDGTLELGRKALQ